MMNRARVTVQAIAAATLCAAASMSHAESAMTGDVKPLASVQFTADDDVKCLSDAIETGDPETGPSTILLKATPGCVVPWHYHTAVEQLIIIRGDVLTEMSGHPAGLLSAGGFAVMESKVPHKFVCQDKNECLMVVIFDRKYDIFWGKGNGAASQPHSSP
jgi:quercetin dioxygenase-like cupin family protein